MKHTTEENIDSILKLYISWHNSQDKLIGTKMADRFEQWFDGLTTIYLGSNKQQHQIYTTICATFSEKLPQIKHPKDLIPFAYQIVQQALKNNPMNKQFDVDWKTSPTNMLQTVWPTLSNQEQQLLYGLYVEKKTPSSSKLLPTLLARNKLKTLINGEFFQQDFDWVDVTDTDKDLIPVPLFEANLLENKPQRKYFECWLINAPSVCQDIREFAPFVDALEKGAVKPVEIQIETPKINTESKTVNELDSAVEAKVKESTKQEEDPVVKPPVPPAESDVNSLMKPILLFFVIAVILGGLWVLLSQ